MFEVKKQHRFLDAERFLSKINSSRRNNQSVFFKKNIGTTIQKALTLVHLIDINSPQLSDTFR